MPEPLLVNFVAGADGPWRVERITAVTGAGLSEVSRLSVSEGRALEPPISGWLLRGVTSNERYVERPERLSLTERQSPLGREDATFAALIPITKASAWWELTQDERRAIFEDRSHHIAIGLEYLPAIARRLHHGRDLGEEFDFLTWFEYAPTYAEAFEDLVGRLRQTEEWSYVEREVDVRLTR
jgi:chlorite dismutase